MYQARRRGWLTKSRCYDACNYVNIFCNCCCGTITSSFLIVNFLVWRGQASTQTNEQQLIMRLLRAGSQLSTAADSRQDQAAAAAAAAVAAVAAVKWIPRERDAVGRERERGKSGWRPHGSHDHSFPLFSLYCTFVLLLLSYTLYLLLHDHSLLGIEELASVAF